MTKAHKIKSQNKNWTYKKKVILNINLYYK